MKRTLLVAVATVAFVACKKKSSDDACQQRRLAAAANIELAQNELAKLEREADAAIAAAPTDNKDGLAEASRQRRKKQRIATRRDLLVHWGAALTGTAPVAIDPNAGGGAGSSTTTGAEREASPTGDNLDDASASFVSARVMVIDFVAACTRN